MNSDKSFIKNFYIKLTKEQSDDLLRYGTFAVYGFNEITEIKYTEFDYGPDSKLPNKFIKIYHISYSGKGVYRSDSSKNEFKHMLELITPIIREHKIDSILW